MVISVNVLYKGLMYKRLIYVRVQARREDLEISSTDGSRIEPSDICEVLYK